MAAVFKHETIPVDASALATFHNKMVASMKSGGGVSFVFDNNDVAMEAVNNDTLTTVLVTDDEDFDGIADNNSEEDEEEWTWEINVI